ncbi:MAG: glycosyltransferase [Candidatus Riflebacteria bacterium]|nr:glycosyltransferase [Candidatus Riflebacteria bacterium]
MNESVRKPGGRAIRVLEVINSSSVGGGQTQLLALARGLPRDRFEIDVAAAPDGPLGDLVRSSGLSFYPLGFDSAWRGRLVRAVRNLVSSGGYRIVHTHGGIAGFWVRAALPGLPPRTVHTLHGIHYLHYANPLTRLACILVDRCLARFTDRIICVSSSDRRQGVAAGVLGASQARVVPNGVEPTELEPSVEPAEVRAALGLSPRVPLIGCVARLHRQKGLPHLLESMATVGRQRPEARLALVGDGPEEVALRSLAANLGITDRILFLGARNDVADLYRAFDLFCLPSLWEGLPISLLEALLMGLPVVATAVDGTVEVVSHEQEGLLVPPGDPGALAGALLRLLDDRELGARLGKAGQARVLSGFTRSRMVELTGQVYDELCPV